METAKPSARLARISGRVRFSHSRAFFRPSSNSSWRNSGEVLIYRGGVGEPGPESKAGAALDPAAENPSEAILVFASASAGFGQP